MIAYLALWPILSWTGEGRRKLRSEEWKGSLRWQDKASGLAGWTVVLTYCLHIVFLPILRRSSTHPAGNCARLSNVLNTICVGVWHWRVIQTCRLSAFLRFPALPFFSCH